MKYCSKCDTTKPLDDFHVNRTRRDGRQVSCKSCMSIRNRAYYLATPERNWQRKASNEAAKRKARKHVTAYLREHPCVDCGEDDIVVLEFDHVKGSKILAVSEMVGRGMGVATIDAEIAKCKVRCANCHRRITHRRRKRRKV